MEKKIIYPAGMSVFMPRDNAPDFVIADISIQPQKFLAFLKENGEYLSDKGFFRFNLKRGTDGTYYMALDTYRPATQAAPVPHNKEMVEDKEYHSAIHDVIGEYPQAGTEKPPF